MNPFINNFDELFARIADSKSTFLFINSNKQDSIFEELLVQTLSRSINGKSIDFIGIKNIKLKPEYKGNKEFTNFIELLISLNRPIMIHDVINPSLIDFFLKYKFGTFIDNKNGLKMLCLYKINFD